MRGNKITRFQKRGFTLIEVLIAGGILFIVSTAIVGLNNSIIQGTASNANQTITNRFASEGLELVTANRDDNLLQANSQNGEQVWFGPAFDPSLYGWYLLSQNNNQWQITKVAGATNILNLSSFATLGETVTSQSLTAYRLICVEAVGAVTTKTATTISCNTDANGAVIVSDGDRTNTTSCDAKDVYCADTQPSLNRDELTGVTPSIIPAGNAVKVRAVVVTSNKANFSVSDIATLLTNWKGYEQL